MDAGFTPLNNSLARLSGPRLVAFTGPAGVGKSEASNLLVSHGFVRVKCADGLKNMLRIMYEGAGLGPDEIERRIEGDLKEKPDPVLRGRTPRHAMQTLGGEWGRDLISPDFWVSILKRRVTLQLQAELPVVIDDLRYPNEAEAVRELGGEIFEIKGSQRRGISTHESEIMDLDPDDVILNDSTVNVFLNRVLSSLGF